MKREIRHFTAEEKAYIEANKERPWMQIAKELGRPDSSVRSYARRSLHLGSRYVSAKAWSKDEINTLIFLSERHTSAEISERMGRSLGGVRHKLQELGIKVLNDCLTLEGMCRDSGYDKYQFERARQALGQKWKTAYSGPSTRYAITFNQFVELCEYLKTEPPNVPKPAAGRFWPKVYKAPDGHWYWKGKSRFIRYWLKGKLQGLRPPRVAWMIVHNVELDSKTLVHNVCGMDGCLNPAHHKLGTRADFPQLMYLVKKKDVSEAA